MFQQISYYLIFGKPLIMYLGIATLLAFFTAASFGYLTLKGKAKISQHFMAIKIAFALAIIHAILGIALYF